MGEFLLFIVGLVFIYFWMGIRIVPQGQEWVVERLGKFDAILYPGLNLIIPLIDKVRYKVTTKDIILDVPQQEVITKDNAVILTNAIAFIKVTKIDRAVYGIENFHEAMRNMVQTSLRSIIGGMDLNSALTSRNQIKALLKAAIASEALDWGLTVKSVEIQDIKPSPNMQLAMEMQASAEREKIAVITRSEGAKQSAILEAEARLGAAKLDAASQQLKAQASSDAMKTIGEAMSQNQQSAMFLLGDRYVHTLERLASSNNSKTILLPGDLMAAIKGIVGK
ncbi:SPFH/Band 7/PHB domain protein [archaeon]|nr:SPFH/Band 7/PHB domain protein [archaeon]